MCYSQGSYTLAVLGDYRTIQYTASDSVCPGPDSQAERCKWDQTLDITT